ncbi:MvdC/MvdD family ATP grasp protein [Flocculibacter collagenilyticus]|uniref:MvdC/MvdD family ATP grasp protein n=1 Tax=Flocculibacter collagenilyticus TaxID=2744479 RepID=UPI0018F471A7|nr:hypothetical protein [Flocculibacter collagenilyticus]
MTNTILIITNSHDLHADLVTKVIDRKQHPYFRINLNQFPRDYQITHSYINGEMSGNIIHLPSGQCATLQNISAVWMRKPADYSYLSDDLSPQERAFAAQEVEQTLFGWIYSLDCFWMSHPLNMRSAMWKGEQLKRALGFGFTVPDSLITNYPDDVISLNKSSTSGIIFKTLSTPTLAAENVQDEEVIADNLPTTMVTPDMLDNIESVKELPCHFQAYVDKEYELRVTVIGQQIFAAKIDSQSDERTKVDSRDMSAEIGYSAITLPEDIQEKCLKFVASYQLNYSALDILVNKKGEYVFLENNPNGQFLYIEQLVPELSMLEAVADTLIKEAKCHHKHV